AGEEMGEGTGRRRAEKAPPRHRWLLRACDERPRRCTAEQRYERASPHGRRSSGFGPHITTPWWKNAAVHHSCALMSQRVINGQVDRSDTTVHVRFAPKAHVSRSTRGNAWRRVKDAGYPKQCRPAALIRKWSAERRLCDTRAAHLFSPIFDRESTRAAADETQVRAGFSHSKRP